MNFCQCGCGQQTDVAEKNDTRGGYVKGQPYRFVQGHHHRPLADRFWEKVDKSGGPDACWPWLGGQYPSGYGKIRGSDGEYLLAHRVAWTLANGPTELDVLHRCDNPPCCNEAHLFDGTQAENFDDMRGKGREAPRVAGRWSTDIMQTHETHGD